MSFFCGLLFVLLFVVLIIAFDLVNKSKEVLAISKSATSTLVDKNLSDLQKEKAMQASSLKLLRLFLEITFWTIVAVAISGGVIWVMEYFKVVTIKDVIETVLTIEFIIVSIIFSGILFLVIKKK